MPVLRTNSAKAGRSSGTCFAETATSESGPSVWTGRALQAESDDLEVIGLALLYPALERNVFVFLAIMDNPRALDLIRVSAPKARCAT